MTRADGLGVGLLLASCVAAVVFAQGTANPAVKPGALGMYNCDWGIGQMPGCVALRYTLPLAMTRLDLDLFNLAAEPTAKATPAAQQAAIAQLNTGLVHVLLQDDTIVYCAQLVLNGGIGAPLCDPARRTQGAGTAGERMVINAVDNDPRNRLWNCATNRVPFGDATLDKSRCFTFVYPVPAGGIRSARLHIGMKVLEGSTEAVIMAHDRPAGAAVPVAKAPPPVTIYPPPPATIYPPAPVTTYPPAPVTIYPPPPVTIYPPPPDTISPPPPVTISPQPPTPKPKPAPPPVARAELPRPPAPAPAATSRPAPTPAKLLGDCDGDGRLTPLDARCALEMSVQLIPARAEADIDQSSEVTSRDATMILQRAVAR